MKIINEKGKFLGLINLVDLLVIVGLLVVGLGLFWKFAGAGLTSGQADGTLTYTVRVRALNPRIETEIKKNLAIDNQLIAGTAYIDDAYVTDFFTEPYIIQTPTADGRLVDAVDPTRVDAVFTVTAKVAKDAPIIKVGPQEIRAGTGHFLKTKYFELASTIETVMFDE